MSNDSKKLILPWADPNKPGNMVLDMTAIYRAEERLGDVRIATQGNASELMGLFNESANTATKYMAWIQFEILKVKHKFDLRKAEVILDEMPDLLEKLKEKGVKGNEDIRSAILAKDPECNRLRERMDCLMANSALLEARVKSFVRAYNTAKMVGEYRGFSAASPMVNNAGINFETFTIEKDDEANDNG